MIEAADSASTSKSQCNFAILCFIRLLLKHISPIVIVLGDLQWADASSLEFVEILLTDQSISQLAIVGIYRSNEIDENHVFHKALKQPTRQSQEDAFSLLKLDIGTLCVEAVSEVIKDLLSVDDNTEGIQDLGEVCWLKTRGNIFFLLRYMEAMQDLQLLKFNLGTCTWTWDLDKIQDSTTVSDNVLDSLKRKMGLLNHTFLGLLKIIACLGSTFEYTSIEWVWSKMKTDSATPLLDAVENLVEKGFIVKLPGDTGGLCWEHDQIQEAAISMMGDEERTKMHRCVAETLFSHLGDSELESTLIFVIVDLLNSSGDFSSDDERLRVADLNCRACRKAMSVAAFESAAVYAKRGIEALPANSWDEHYYLSLRLYSMGAESTGFIGETSTMEKFCHEVIDRGSIPFQDKHDAYSAWIDYLLNAGSISQARDLLFELLAAYGVRIQKNSMLLSMGILGQLFKIKRTLHSRDLSHFKTAEDATTPRILKLLDKLTTSLYQLDDDRMPMVIFKGLNLSISNGYSEYTPVFMVLTGMILAGVLNDLNGGCKYARMATALTESPQLRKTMPRTLFCACGFVLPWKEPMHDILKLLLQGYDAGLLVGDTESAMFCIYTFNLFKFILGGRLESIEGDCRVYCKQMKDLKRDPAFYICLNLRQVCLNLMGKENRGDPCRMIGVAMTKAHTETTAYQANPSVQLNWNGCRGMLLTLFGRHVECADFFLENGVDKWDQTTIGFAIHIWRTLLRGVSFFAAAKITGKRKYLRVARRMHRRLLNWHKQGSPNLIHYISFLHAEDLWYRKKHSEAISLFEITLVQAARAGHLQDAGLASERLSQLYMEQTQQMEEVQYRLSEAIRFYREWGAHGKVEKLLEEQEGLQLMPAEVALVDRLSSCASNTSAAERNSH